MLEIRHGDKELVFIPVTVLSGTVPTTPGALEVARTTLGGADPTSWASANYDDGHVVYLFDATEDTEGTSHELWLRVTDNPEVITRERVAIIRIT